SIHITTGRKLSEGLAQDVDSAVVMLDNGTALRTLSDANVDIYCGAYLGTPDEILSSGKLSECIDEIERVRSEQRTRKGWIMDTYLLRRVAPQYRACGTQSITRAPTRPRRAGFRDPAIRWRPPICGCSDSTSPCSLGRPDRRRFPLCPHLGRRRRMRPSRRSAGSRRTAQHRMGRCRRGY